MAKIARLFLKGDYDSTMTSIATALGINASDIKVKEHETRCAVEVTDFPIAVYEKTIYKTRQIEKIIKQLMPVGVELILDSFSGTFRLCENEGEMSDTTGLADEAGTIGGSLGLVLGEDD